MIIALYALSYVFNNSFIVPGYEALDYDDNGDSVSRVSRRGGMQPGKSSYHLFIVTKGFYHLQTLTTPWPAPTLIRLRGRSHWVHLTAPEL